MIRAAGSARVRAITVDVQPMRSVAASWLPARHAMRVNPAIAMRLE